MKIWVKIPEKPTAKSIETCLESLLKQLHKVDPYRFVSSVKINKDNRSFEIHVDD